MFCDHLLIVPIFRKGKGAKASKPARRKAVKGFEEM
jgi:hypothetical protein